MVGGGKGEGGGKRPFEAHQVHDAGVVGSCGEEEGWVAMAAPGV